MWGRVGNNTHHGGRVLAVTTLGKMVPKGSVRFVTADKHFVIWLHLADPAAQILLGCYLLLQGLLGQRFEERYRKCIGSRGSGFCGEGRFNQPPGSDPPHQRQGAPDNQ